MVNFIWKLQDQYGLWFSMLDEYCQIKMLQWSGKIRKDKGRNEDIRGKKWKY